MKLWISKNSEVPVAEQLTTQIMLAINSGELKPNQKLPSTRELARRFALHSNTVNAAYRDLARRGWLHFRRGSGVYVRGLAPDLRLDDRLQLDQLISAFLKMAREQGFTLSEIRSRVKGWLDFQPPDHLLVIEPDVELRRILLAEIREATSFPVLGAGLDACKDTSMLAGAAPVSMYGRADELKKALPLDVSCLLLRSGSAAELEKLQINLPFGLAVAVVSRWPDFLRWARAVLLARGLDAARLSFRDAREKHWRKGLRSCVVVTDMVTVAQLPRGCRPLFLKVVAESSLQELRQFVDQFLGRAGGASSIVGAISLNTKKAHESRQSPEIR
jgi:DNA-binding transcriptional regulator YhcF (GntR family)